MDGEERYNLIIDEIENLVKGTIDENGDGQYYTTKKIREIAFKKANLDLDYRSKNVIFSFILGRSVNDYIKERQFVYVFKLLQENPDAVDKAVDATKKHYPKRFIGEFNDLFDVTPDQIDRSTNIEALFPKLSWDKISYEGRGKDFQRFYHLTSDESLLACKISRENDLDLRKTYCYISEYLNIIVDDNQKIVKNENACEYLNDKDVLDFYFLYDLGLNDILLVMLAKHLDLIDTNKSEYDIEELIAISCYMEVVCEGLHAPKRFNNLVEHRYLDEDGVKMNLLKEYEFFKKECDYEYTGYDFALFLLLKYDPRDYSINKKVLNDMIYLNQNVKEVLSNNYMILHMKDNQKADRSINIKHNENKGGITKETAQEYYKNWIRARKKTENRKLSFYKNLNVCEYLDDRRKNIS